MRYCYAFITGLLLSVNASAEVVVEPDTPIVVSVSNSNPNRIKCDHNIKDFYGNKELPLQTKIDGKNMTLSFLSVKTGDELIRTTKISTAYIYCGEDVFELTLEPKERTGATIYLKASDGEKQQKVEELKARDFEQAIIEVYKAAYHDEVLPFEAKKGGEEIKLYKEIKIVKRRTVNSQGVGFYLDEYTITAKEDGLRLSEKHFLRKEFGLNIKMVSVEPRLLNKGDKARLFIANLVPDKK
jgi:hypothetical protein